MRRKNPFMAGVIPVREPDCKHVGVSRSRCSARLLRRLADCDAITEIANIVKKTAFKITRTGQLVALRSSRRLCVLIWY